MKLKKYVMMFLAIALLSISLHVGVDAAAQKEVAEEVAEKSMFDYSFIILIILSVVYFTYEYIQQVRQLR